MSTPLYWRRGFFALVILMAAVPADFRSVAVLPYPRRPQNSRWKAEPERACSQDPRRQAGSYRHLGNRPAAGPSSGASRPAANFETLATNDDFLALVKRSAFWNLGSSFKDGLPFTPWAAELHRQRVADNNKDNPDAHCLPMGMMQFHNHPQPRKMIQTPQVIVILYEANAGIRQIFLDGRPLPKDADPWWYGYSTGHWEGDTLVVQSAGFRDLGWLDVEGSPLTEGAHVTERYRRPDFGHLDIEVTIDDPKAYTKPWTVSVHQVISVDTELIEFVCQEDEKDAPHLTGK